MDSKKFIEFLSGTSNISQSSLTAEKYESLLGEVINKISNHISLPLIELLNIAVECLEEGELYCEVDRKSFSNFLPVLVNNLQVLAYFIDENCDNSEELEECLKELNLVEQVCIYEGECINFCQELQEIDTEDRIGVFHYNSSIDYRNLLLTLMSIKHLLADEALIIISNADNIETQQAITDFQSFHPIQQVQKLITETKQGQLSHDFSDDITVLRWQNNLDSLIAKRINKEGFNKISQATNQNKKIVLHVGCGMYRENALPQDFRGDDWIEIRLDIDHNVQPDIIGTITDLSGVPYNSVDAVYSSHNLEHIYNFEVPLALAEFKRVLKSGGIVMFVVPDMQTAAEWVIKGDIEDIPLYDSPAGGVSALWMFYGIGTSYPEIPYMAHKTGFTVKNLQAKLRKAGFQNLTLNRRSFDIVAYGYKI